MNYLEKEIDSTLAEQSLAHEKLCDDELSKLITRLTTLFFFPETKGLDPYLQIFEKPVLIVQDSKIHAWKLETSADLKMLFSETTGFPFWIADNNLKVLIYMDDHDCVHTSDCTQ